jgi:hypothetical protein
VRSQVSAAGPARQTERPAIRIQDIRILLRAQEIVNQLAAGGLAPAIEAARELLVESKTRWQYLQEMLPVDVAQRVPNEDDTFEVQCADSHRFVLTRGPLPVLRQIANLERQHRTLAISVIQYSNGKQQVYWL